MNPSERAEGPADERAAFEVWAHLNLFGLELNAAGSYEHRATRYAWQGWLARSRLAAATPVVRPLAWTVHMQPNESCRYNHTSAETPFGRFLITWKGWKQHDDPTIDETPWGEFEGAFYSVEAAQQAAAEMWRAKVLSCLAASPSPRTPEQPEQPSVNPVERVLRDMLVSTALRAYPEKSKSEIREEIDARVRSVGTRLAAVDDGRDTRALLTALRYYARGQHFIVQDDDFDTVSGEPQNWQSHHDEPIMFEDGTVARMALRGEPINWLDGGEDETPQPIDGEPA